MSMRDYPSSAYVVPAIKIKELLDKDKQEKYQKLLDEGDTEAISDFLSENLPDNWPCFESVYRPADEDTVDGVTMKHGEIYLLFEEDKLFTKSPSAGLTVMHKAGINPKFSCFSVWL